MKELFNGIYSIMCAIFVFWKCKINNLIIKYLINHYSKGLKMSESSMRHYKYYRDIYKAIVDDACKDDELFIETYGQAPKDELEDKIAGIFISAINEVFVCYENLETLVGLY